MLFKMFLLLMLFGNSIDLHAAGRAAPKHETKRPAPAKAPAKKSAASLSADESESDIDSDEDVEERIRALGITDEVKKEQVVVLALKDAYMNGCGFGAKRADDYVSYVTKDLNTIHTPTHRAVANAILTGVPEAIRMHQKKHLSNVVPQKCRKFCKIEPDAAMVQAFVFTQVTQLCNDFGAICISLSEVASGVRGKSRSSQPRKMRILAGKQKASLLRQARKQKKKGGGED